MERNPRPHQQDILTYSQGSMGIAAVPGSGKTWTLSALAAMLIEEQLLEPHQEVLIVTLTNSAVDNFSARIEAFLGEEGYRTLIPPYRVRTLHGLAHDIVRERPDLAGLDASFTIIDEQAANRIRDDVAVSWLQDNRHILDPYLDHELEENRLDWVVRERLPRLIQDTAMAFIRTCKDRELTPDQLQDQIDRLQLPLPLFEMGAAMYHGYHRALAYRGAVDFDDLIRLALQVIQTDPEYLARLQDRWPYILEDEAQDSSRLQEVILRTLSSGSGNWVRVGDPNQAIFESFTTADPQYLLDFIAKCDHHQELPQSGRSTQSIIDLANSLIDWTNQEHPHLEVRSALVQPHIEPVPSDDPDPNPPDHPEQIYLIPTPFEPQEELLRVADSLDRWLPDHPEETVGVLVPRANRGAALADILKQRGIEYNESLLKSTTSTRRTAGALTHVLRYLGNPGNARLLAKTYEVWRRDEQDAQEVWNRVKEISSLLAKCPRVEDYIWSRTGLGWLESLDLAKSDPDALVSLDQFREYIRRWQGTVLLPVDQVVLTLSQDLFHEPSELALIHKLASLLRQAEKANPTWRLGEIAGELAVIARNERRFLGFSPEDTGFNPENYPGVVVISTMHKAKGLEWDRVYLMAVNNYNFPSGDPEDQFLPEKWFIRSSRYIGTSSAEEDHLNIQAETLAQLDIAYEPDMFQWYQEGEATLDARLDYIRERLRLFYVGITRARKELVITTNTGKRGNLHISKPFDALIDYWQERRLPGSSESES